MTTKEKNLTPTNPKFQALILEISGPVLYLKPSLPQVFYQILSKYWNENTLDETQLPPLTILSMRKAINAAEKWLVLRNHKKGRLISTYEQERYRRILFSTLGLKNSRKQEFLDQLILKELEKKLNYEVQPGLQTLLETIHDTFNIPIFFVDDWKKEFAINILKKKKLLYPFCHVITSDQINIAKPHPQFFEAVIKSFPRKIRPSRTLYVTDNPHEIPFVKNIGMKLYYLDLSADKGFHVYITPKYLQPPKPLVPIGKDLSDLGDFMRKTFSQRVHPNKKNSKSLPHKKKGKTSLKKKARPRHRAA